MPHALHVPSGSPDRSKPARPPDPAPAIRPSPVCPNCGRRPAVVFPNLRREKATNEPPLVCLECCPKARGEDGAGSD